MTRARALLGCIADDFTGATDLANNLVRAGMRVVQAMGVPTAPLDTEADAIVVALKSRTIPKGEFPPGVKVGGQLQGVGNDGQPAVFNVVKIKGPEVHLDGNHPLAGQALTFSCKVTEAVSYTHLTLPTKA